MEGHDGYSKESETMPPVKGKFIPLRATNAQETVELHLHPFQISCQMEVSSQLYFRRKRTNKKVGRPQSCSENFDEEKIF
jgi:hypothetical protein